MVSQMIGYSYVKNVTLHLQWTIMTTLTPYNSCRRHCGYPHSWQPPWTHCCCPRPISCHHPMARTRPCPSAFAACASAADDNNASIPPPCCSNGTQTSSAPLTYWEDPTRTASVFSIRVLMPPRTTDLPELSSSLTSSMTTLSSLLFSILSADAASTEAPARPPHSPAAAPATFPAIVIAVFVIMTIVIANPPCNAIAIIITDAITIVAHHGLFALFGMFHWRASPSTTCVAHVRQKRSICQSWELAMLLPTCFGSQNHFWQLARGNSWLLYWDQNFRQPKPLLAEFCQSWLLAANLLPKTLAVS